MLVVLVVASLGAGVALRWDRIGITPDSEGYIAHDPTRTVAYPAFIDVFDRGHPVEPLTTDLLGVDTHGDPRPGAEPVAASLNKPGYDDTWYDYETRTIGRS